jgi:diguanylate cyclase (GGDEF)-like protein
MADEQVELAIARALGAMAQADPVGGLAVLDAVADQVADQVDQVADQVDDPENHPPADRAHPGGDDRASLRLRCLHAQVRSELLEASGDRAAALQALRRWQGLNAQRARQASRARYQAAALQTELVKLQHRLEENDAKRRATERARAELSAANEQLSSRMREIEALQTALREQATHDALTGLANRRHLNDTLPQVLALALREGTPLAVVLIDLDHFKTVNDEHGHDVGDHLLAAFGGLLRKHLRTSDLAFRHGGEEFCLLMPNTRATDAARKAEALLQRWRAQVFKLDATTLRAQSFSAGVTDTMQAPLSPAGLLKHADSHLLQAKREGRARIVGHRPGRAMAA